MPAEIISVSQNKTKNKQENKIKENLRTLQKKKKRVESKNKNLFLWMTNDDLRTTLERTANYWLIDSLLVYMKEFAQ